jgi:LysR family transcriptional regulator, hypochlorite-specific transcription factor HypT
MMDSEWLDDYLALLEFGNFSRAAERRNVSQPSFSRRIRALEDWVGASLFDRSTHTIRLTPAGDSFRPVAEETLRRLQIGREVARVTARASAETLRFASTNLLSLTFFPTWLRQMEEQVALTARIELTSDTMVACERLMIEGRAQFLLCHHHGAAVTRLGSDFRSIRLGSDRLLPVAAPTLLDREVKALPQLAFSGDSGMGRILTAAWKAAGVAPMAPPVFTSHSASALISMARDGRGVAWSVLSTVQDDLEAGRLSHAGHVDDEIAIEIRLWRPKARQSPAAEALWSQLTKTGPETALQDA